MSSYCQLCQRGYITEMSRTRVRVVLILIVLILVMAAILSGVLTYWVGAVGLPFSKPQDGEAGQALPAGDCAVVGSGQPEYRCCRLQ